MNNIGQVYARTPPSQAGWALPSEAWAAEKVDLGWAGDAFGRGQHRRHVRALARFGPAKFFEAACQFGSLAPKPEIPVLQAVMGQQQIQHGLHRVAKMFELFRMHFDKKHGLMPLDEFAGAEHNLVLKTFAVDFQ